LEAQAALRLYLERLHRLPLDQLVALVGQEALSPVLALLAAQAVGQQA